MNSDVSPETTSSKKKVKRWPLILAISAVLIVISIAVFVMLGILYVGVKKPSQIIVTQTLVCSSDDALKKLNGYLSDIANDGDRTKAKQAIDYITSQSGYESDPTCAEALARFYYMNRDPENLGNQIDVLERLAQKGQYPSNKFDSLSSLSGKALDYGSLTGRSR